MRGVARVSNGPSGALRRGVALTALLIALFASASAAHAGEVAIGVTVGAEPRLVVFDTDAPGTAIYSRPVKGLTVGEQVVGIDMRSFTGEVFGLTSNARVFTVDPQSGVITHVGTQIGTVPPFTAGSPPGVDFNPTVDRLRLVDEANDNLRFNPVTFQPVDGDANAGNGTTPDASLAYIGTDANVGQNPGVVASAYDRNDLDGATATTLFGIDSALDLLVRQGAVDGNAGDVPGGGSANGGLLTTLGSLGVNVSTTTALDIAPGGAGSPGGIAYMAAVPQGGGGSTLYDIDISAPGVGSATALGAIGGDPLAGMTIALGGGVGFGAKVASVGESGEVTVTVKRTGRALSAPATGTVQVPFQTMDGTAEAGRDYTPVSGTLEFAPGETTKQIGVPLIADGDTENAETFSLRLDPAVGGAVLTAPEQTIEIEDDDRPAAPRLQLLIAANAPRSLKALRKARSLKARISCSTPCAAQLTLSFKSKAIGTGSATIDPAGVAEVTVTLSKSGRKALKKALKGKGAAALKLAGQATGQAGSSAGDSAGFRVPRG
jgi:uncharacterized protein DUF4394/Calx-beta domain-containing protein